MIYETQTQSDVDAAPANRPTASTLRKLNEKIAYQQSRKKPRSTLAGRQPTSCPDCEEKWIGLARRGSCPACGLVYDENTRAWSGRRRARLGTPLLVTAVVIALCVMYYDVFWVVVPAVLLIPAYLGWVIYDFLVSRDGRFIATTPVGVLYRIGSHKTRKIAWDRIVLVEATAYSMPVFKVHHKKRVRRIRINKAIRHCRDGCEFAVAVEDGVKRYASPMESRDPNSGRG